MTLWNHPISVCRTDSSWTIATSFETTYTSCDDSSCYETPSWVTSTKTYENIHIPIQVRWASTDLSILETDPLTPGAKPQLSTSLATQTIKFVPVTDTPPVPDAGNNTLSAGAQAGIAIGVILFVITLACLGLMATRRRWNRHWKREDAIRQVQAQQDGVVDRRAVFAPDPTDPEHQRRRDSPVPISLMYGQPIHCPHQLTGKMPPRPANPVIGIALSSSSASAPTPPSASGSQQQQQLQGGSSYVPPPPPPHHHPSISAISIASEESVETGSVRMSTATALSVQTTPLEEYRRIQDRRTRLLEITRLEDEAERLRKQVVAGGQQQVAGREVFELGGSQ